MEAVLDRHIEKSPDVRGGKPRLAGTRITVDDVVIMHLRLGQSLDEIGAKYIIPLSSLYAAMAYYFDHRSDIDAQIADDEALTQAFRHDNPSPLQMKLRALGLE